LASDPYTYPGTETLRNRLGLTDEKTLIEAERRLTQARGAEAARLTFPATTDGYRALHKHLFQDLYDWAGQDRTVNIAKGGSSFAAVPYVARELDKRFADMGAQSGFRGLPRDEFFDRLGDHINEINAIHPFREGNGRTMRHHAAQLAREAGHPIRIAAIDKDKWMEASRHGFLTGIIAAWPRFFPQRQSSATSRPRRASVPPGLPCFRTARHPRGNAIASPSLRRAKNWNATCPPPDSRRPNDCAN
jgi:cell filamentation protein